MNKQHKKSALAETKTDDAHSIGKLLERKLEAPPIEEVLAAAEQSLKAAQKQVRRHVCRICREEKCIHYQREYVDTKEEVDMKYNRETGELYEDLGGGD